MTTTTVVHLLRHGEVDNPAGVLYGRLPDFHLSKRGTRMAELAASWFDGRDIAAVYSSPLERAQETAEALTGRFGLEAGTDERLLEAANTFQGRNVNARAFTQPRTWAKLYNPFRPSWGEPYADIAARMTGAITTARQQTRGREVVCVSHQLPIWVVRRAAENKRLWHHRRQCNLASVTSLRFDGDSLVSVSYSEPAAELYDSGSAVAGA